MSILHYITERRLNLIDLTAIVVANAATLLYGWEAGALSVIAGVGISVAAEAFAWRQAVRADELSRSHLQEAAARRMAAALRGFIKNPSAAGALPSHAELARQALEMWDMANKTEAQP